MRLTKRLSSRRLVRFTTAGVYWLQCVTGRVVSLKVRCLPESDIHAHESGLVKDESGESIWKGKNCTGFSNDEEEQAGLTDQVCL